VAFEVCCCFGLPDIVAFTAPWAGFSRAVFEMFNILVTLEKHFYISALQVLGLIKFSLLFMRKASLLMI
jgi:hypothetical protein